MDIVQRRSESDFTVIFSSFTIFDVLINPPNLISVSAEQKKKGDQLNCIRLKKRMAQVIEIQNIISGTYMSSITSPNIITLFPLCIYFYIRFFFFSWVGHVFVGHGSKSRPKLI